MNFDKAKLIESVPKLRNSSILIVGDLALDEMIYGDAERISREAPVLILQHTRTKLILGGASNAAHNVATLNDGKVGVIGVAGEDYHSDLLKETFKDAGINCDGIVDDPKRKTIVKTRISGSITTSITQQIVRIDRQSKGFISKETEDKLIKEITELMPLYDAVIISNYHIGTLTPKIIDYTIELANKLGKVIVVDAQRDLNTYKNVTSMTPNLPDTEKSVGFEIKSIDDMKKAGDKLLKETNAKSVLITCGADGMFMTEPNGKYTKIPVFNKSEVFDVTGAGDTVTAVYSLALASGIDPVYSAVIGNVAASIVVRQYGCATTTIEDLLSAIEKL
ncbi:MAG TPA: D-glycero-beta-D-manno-heptose-7-phosphate kinase [Cyanobacteria bacterium UBA11991]|nr:bifunctional ADP-heptose synthase [Cyanobacteriota bacterium]MDY6359006.1 bifunctional ADP-heptose synthase [Cyanobacteriota bacterium]MDY6363448.1 bifunctional ADP-heptose synthase [Cyanobacteriota bacterium]MDY6382705.1 bifunctional ADP-heptose synthase [Cyanobacteriota bacterium]HCB10582.1 D-glycero-beta-D-manno-heptose-7-phosphate kinase [Cyanobacteria bacterium UBA11991]